LGIERRKEEKQLSLNTGRGKEASKERHASRPGEGVKKIEDNKRGRGKIH